MKYFGKRYLHNFLKDNIFDDVPPSTRFEYGKLKGDEWIKNVGYDEKKFDLFCVQQNAIYLSVFEYDESTDKDYETERYGYKRSFGEWKLEYKRIGQRIEVARQLTFDDIAQGVQ